MSDIKDRIANYVLEALPIENIEEIEDIDDNPGGFWINLKNGETYFLMVGKCEIDANENSSPD